MNLIALLGKSLKSPELLNLFEDYNVQVTYTYDRLQEGLDDKYYGSLYELGLEFIFDEQQILKTIFVFTQSTETYHAATTSELGLECFESKTDALAYANKNKIEFREGNATLFGNEQAWIKFMFNEYSVHYEFVKNTLTQVTLQSEC